MLFAIGVVAVADSPEPFRVAMTVLMLNRPRPQLQLRAFCVAGSRRG
jgi:hypothetical protein